MRCRRTIIAVVAVLLVIGCLSLKFSHQEKRHLLIQDQLYGLTLGSPFVYSWYEMRSLSNVIFAVKRSTVVTAVEINLISGLRQTNDVISYLLTEGVVANVGGPTWTLSSLADSLLVVCLSNTSSIVKEFEFASQRIVSEVALPPPQHSWHVQSFSGTNNWLAYSAASLLEEGIVGSRDGILHSIKPFTQKSLVLGVDGGGDLLQLNVQYDLSMVHLEIIRSQLFDKSDYKATNMINVPISCEKLSATLSPRGDAILWLLTAAPVKHRQLVFSPTFPFLVINTRFEVGRSSVWLSDVQGKQLCCLGELSEGRNAVGELHWCPGGTAFAIQVDSELSIIPISQSLLHSRKHVDP